MIYEIENRKLLKKNNIGTWILGLIGIIISITFFYVNRTFKEISYLIDEKPTLIANVDDSSIPFKLCTQDSIQIIENVYLLSGKIWNSGNVTLEKKDIRRDINISLSGTIIAFKVEKEKENGVSGFRLTKINDSTLSVSWKYFDPDNGFKYNIFYSGDENPNFRIKGKIYKLDDFREISSSSTKSLFRKILFFLSAFIWAIAILAQVYISIQNGSTLTARVWLIIFFLLIVSIILLLGDYFPRRNFSI